MTTTTTTTRLRSDARTMLAATAMTTTTATRLRSDARTMLAATAMTTTTTTTWLRSDARTMLSATVLAMMMTTAMTMTLELPYPISIQYREVVRIPQSNWTCVLTRRIPKSPGQQKPRLRRLTSCSMSWQGADLRDFPAAHRSTAASEPPLAVDEVEMFTTCLSTNEVSDDHGRPLQGKPGVSPCEKVEDPARNLNGLD